MAIADVTVMGAGIFGLSVAYACQGRGAKVQVIDPRGVAGGASGGIVGALAPHVPENWNNKKAFQFESLLMAAEFWAGVAEASGQTPGYERSGRLQPLGDEAAVALARQRADSAKDLWQGEATWRVIPADTVGPWAPPSPTGLLVHDTLSARIHPRRATQALAAAIGARRGLVHKDGAAQGRVVWATGWEGLQAMTAQHHRQVGNGVKGQALLLDYAAPGAPQLFADKLHFVPHGDGTLAIGSTSERDFEDPVAVDAQLDALHARALVAMPALRDAKVLLRWAGVRPRARSRAPMLGRHPFRAGEFVANGGFKIGFGMAPKVGAVMADLILEGQDAIPPAFLAEVNL